MNPLPKNFEKMILKIVTNKKFQLLLASKIASKIANCFHGVKSTASPEHSRAIRAFEVQTL